MKAYQGMTAAEISEGWSYDWARCLFVNPLKPSGNYMHHLL
jgi:hypothetical protein